MQMAMNFASGELECSQSQQLEPDLLIRIIFSSCFISIYNVTNIPVVDILLICTKNNHKITKKRR